MWVNGLMVPFQSDGIVLWTVIKDNPTSSSFEHYYKHGEGINYKVIQNIGFNGLKCMKLQWEFNEVGRG